MATKRRATFRQIIEEVRLEAAETAWYRAKQFSRLRHLEANSGHRHNSRRLADLKAKAIRLAVSLAPEQIKVTIDGDYQIGLLSVRWPGHGRLHLPASAQLI